MQCNGPESQAWPIIKLQIRSQAGQKNIGVCRAWACIDNASFGREQSRKLTDFWYGLNVKQLKHRASSHHFNNAKWCSRTPGKEITGYMKLNSATSHSVQLQLCHGQCNYAWYGTKSATTSPVPLLQCCFEEPHTVLYSSGISSWNFKTHQGCSENYFSYQKYINGHHCCHLPNL